MKKIVLFITLGIIPFISTIAQAPADNCATATLLTVGGSCGLGTLVSGDGLEPGVNNTNICASGQNIGSREGWFRFVATATTATITGVNSNRNLTIQVFSGSCGSLTEIGCANATTAGGGSTETANVSGLTIGNIYYVRVGNISNNDLNLTSLCVTSAIVPPNDDPCSATALPAVTSTCTYTNSTNANATASGGVPAPGCANYLGGDVWFTVVVPASGNLTLDSQTGVILDGGMAVYSGTCGSLTLVACDDDGSANGAMSMINLSGQTPGATLFIRMWEYGGDNNGTFGICAFDGSSPSQNCSGAIPVCNDATFAGNSSGFATQELNGTNQGCLTANEHQTTWFGFSPSLTGTIQLNINPTAGAIDYDFAIWGPYPPGTGCPVTGTPLRCSFAAQTGTTGLMTGAGDNSEGAAPATTPRFVESIIIGAAELGQIYYLVVDNFTANSTPFTLDWTLSPNNMLDCTPPLPIQLALFNGKSQEETNQIYWKTQAEINNSYFIIEKSTDGISYTELGRKQGHNSTNIVNEYEMIDNTPAGVTYYRLIQVDQNGTSTTYGPIVITNNNANQFSLQNLYPNPTDVSFFIDLYSKGNSTSNIVVYNSVGQMVYNKEIEIEGAVKIEIPSDLWTPGVYIVKIINEENHFQKVERVIIK